MWVCLQLLTIYHEIDVQETVDLINRGHYQLACTKYFELTHGQPPERLINHPNQYFEDSQNVKNGKAGVRKKEITAITGNILNEPPEVGIHTHTPNSIIYNSDCSFACSIHATIQFIGTEIWEFHTQLLSQWFLLLDCPVFKVWVNLDFNDFSIANEKKNYLRLYFKTKKQPYQVLETDP